MKRIICFVVIIFYALALMTACDKSGYVAVDEADSLLDGQGSFIEQDITPPNSKGQPHSIYIADNGEISIVNSFRRAYPLSGFEHFISDDFGETWNEGSMEWANEFLRAENFELENEQTDFISNIHALDNGNLLINMWNSEINTNAFYLKRSGGELQQLNISSLAVLDDLDYSNSNVIYSLNLAKYLGSGTAVFKLSKAYVSLTDKEADDVDDLILIYDLYRDKLINSYSGKAYAPYYYDDDFFYVNLPEAANASKDEDRFLAISLKEEADAKAVTIRNINRLTKYEYGLFGAGDIYKYENNTFYMAGKHGVVKVDENGGETVIFSPEGFILASPLSKLAYAEIIDEENIFYQLEKGGLSKLYCYRFDKTASNTREKEINVFCLYDSVLLDLVKIEYEAMYRDTTVNINNMYSRYDNKTPTVIEIDDILKKLNTELLAGSGPDVIILDDLPYKQFIKQGIFEDLTSIADEYGVIESIKSSLAAESGSLFSLPTHFTVSVLLSDNELEKYMGEQGFDRLIEDIFLSADYSYLGKTEPVLVLEERPLIYFASFNELYDFVIKANISKIFIEENEIDYGELSELLEVLKSVAVYYSLLDEYRGKYNHANIFDISFGWYDDETDIMYKNSRLAAFGNYKAKTCSSELDSPRLITTAAFFRKNYERMYISENYDKEELKKENKVYVKAMPSRSGGVYTPVNMVSINAKSKNKNEALNFLRLFLSPTIQNPLLHEGLPSTASGLESVFNEEFAESEITKDFSYDFDIDEILQGIEFPYEKLHFPEQVIFDNALNYCLDEIDLEAAISNIQNELMIYLLEKES